MVRKDFNHPSVILYSIGNEIPEAGTTDGCPVGRALAEKIRSLDGTRFVTEAISGLLVGGSELFAELGEEHRRGNARQAAGAGRGDGREHGHDADSPTGSTQLMTCARRGRELRPDRSRISMWSGTTTWSRASRWTASSTRTG